jgi:release factor glutamine methyltransferase
MGNRSEAPAAFSDELRALVTRRAAREPVAYLTGRREFYGRTFRVSPAVLIPRPETEHVIDAALPLLRGADMTIVDLGTGSGCLAITLALECTRARVIGTDTSRAALAVARENARALGAVVEFVEADWLPADVVSIDLIVSNPPYVPERERVARGGCQRFRAGLRVVCGPDA